MPYTDKVSFGRWDDTEPPAHPMCRCTIDIIRQQHWYDPMIDFIARRLSHNRMFARWIQALARAEARSERITPTKPGIYADDVLRAMHDRGYTNFEDHAREVSAAIGDMPVSTVKSVYRDGVKVASYDEECLTDEGAWQKVVNGEWTVNRYRSYKGMTALPDEKDELIKELRAQVKTHEFERRQDAWAAHNHEREKLITEQWDDRGNEYPSDVRVAPRIFAPRDGDETERAEAPPVCYVIQQLVDPNRSRWWRTSPGGIADSDQLMIETDPPAKVGILPLEWRDASPSRVFHNVEDAVQAMDVIVRPGTLTIYP